MTDRLISGLSVVGHDADSVLIQDGMISKIGWEPHLHQSGLEHSQVPGSIAQVLHDHHFHPIGYASAVTGLSLKAATNYADLSELLRGAASHLAPGQALIGNRLDDETLAEGRLPTRAHLDRMVADRPVLLHRYCGHIAIANTPALELAGLDPLRSDGILRETEIQPVSSAVFPHQPPLGPDEIGRALAGLAGLGLERLTVIVSASEPLWCGVGDEIGTLAEIAPTLALDLRVLVIADTPTDLETAANRLRGAASNVDFLGWKGFADGSLGGHTAALYEPYADEPTMFGTLRLDHERARTLARASLDLGGIVAIHAIGDRANDQVLDLFEPMIRGGADPGRFRIEHASMLTVPAVARMAALGVTASVQPAFRTSEVGWLPKRLGSRTEQTYNLGQLSEAGVPMVGGSDCPVESPNPWWGMAAALGPTGLSIAESWSLFGDPLRVGDRADFMVIDRDPLVSGQTGGEDLANTRVLGLYRQGKAVLLEPELAFS